MGICSLKIGWDIARAFLMENALIVLPLDFYTARRQPQRWQSFTSFWVFFVVFYSFEE
jgi:hypothetical protein